MGKKRRKPQAGAKPLLRERAARGSPLRERAAPPPRSYPVRGPCLAARHSGPVPSRRAVCSPRPTRRSTCARAGRARRYVRRRSAVITSRGDVRCLPVTTSHQQGDVVPSRRAMCSPRPIRRATCARAGRSRRYVHQPSAVITSRGDVRSLPITSPHQQRDVVPSRRAVCSPRPTRRSTCARAGRARRCVRRRSAVITSRGRAHPPGHYLSLAGGRGPLSASGVLSSTYASIYGLLLGSLRSAVPPSPVRVGEGCCGGGVR